MFESNYKQDTCVLAKCLSDTENAPDVVRSSKESILRSDLNILLSASSECSSSAAPAALIASHTSWRRLWDAALDKGVKGTRALQTLFKELCRPSSCFKCSLCDRDVPLNTSCLQHACDVHSDVTDIPTNTYDPYSAPPTPSILWTPFSNSAKLCQIFTPCGLLNQFSYNFLYLLCTFVHSAVHVCLPVCMHIYRTYCNFGATVI